MPMKTIEGYSKEKYTNTSVLLAGGGAKALSDFIGSLSWDSTNKKIKYTPVGGSATDLVTLSWDNIANKPTSLPANGGNADTSNRTKFLETFQQNSTTTTYGSQYPIWAQWSDATNVRLKCTNYTVWTDKADNAINADKLDGQHGSRYTSALGGSNYVTFTVEGDANTYYPVVITNTSDYYPMQLVNISRAYHETAPDTWNTSTHRGGLTLTLLWNGSRYWDGNTSGGACYCVYHTESYSTMVGGLGNSTGGKVVWLRGGGAVYHIHSMNGTSTTVTVYTSTYTDSASQSFAPKTSPEGITISWPGYSEGVTVNSSDSDSTYKMLWHSGNTLYSTAGIYCNPYKDYLYAASMQTSDWFRSTGNTGWYNNTYDGGWYMEDSTYIRTYNSKCVYNSNTSQYAFYTPGGITVGSHLWGTSTASTWLAGQKEDRAVINITNSTDATSFWPLIKWTSSSQGRWDTIGVLGNNLYFMSSLTSRTENDYDTAAYFDMTTSRLYSNGVYHTSYGSSAYALTSDGGVAAIANMSVANAENIWLRESSTNSDCRLAFGTYNSAYTSLNSSQYLTYNPYSGRLKLKGSKEYNSVNHGGSISFGDGDYLYMKEAKDDVLLQHYRGLVSDTQPIAIGFVGSCPSNSSASLVYKKSQPSAITVLCNRVSSGRFRVLITNNSGKPIIAHLQVTPVRNYANYEFAFAYIEDFTMDAADGGMEIASGTTESFYVRTGRIHCQGTWAAGDYVATGDTGGFTGVVYAMINEDLSTMPTTSW